MQLSDREQAMQAGEFGPACQWAIDHQLQVGRMFDAPDMVEVSQTHMLADPESAFTKAIGLEMDGSGFGMGQRSQRYSMIVKDGTVAELNVEQGGGFEVSSADYLLGQL